jgi:hypothetical protein
MNKKTALKKLAAYLLGLVALGLMTMQQAEAALSAAISGTLTGIQTDGLALVDLVWPVVGAITGAFILFKLFKRGTSKI